MLFAFVTASTVSMRKPRSFTETTENLKIGFDLAQHRIVRRKLEMVLKRRLLFS